MKICVQEYYIKEITQNFMQNQFIYGRTKSTRSIRSLGIFLKRSDEFIGFAQFGTPQDPEIQKRHSTQFLNMFFKQNYDIIDADLRIVEFYVAHYNPADIFAYKTFKDNEQIGEHSNFIVSHAVNLTKNLNWQAVNIEDGMLYEWVNPEISFYTYKITAHNSDKYYYGVRSIKGQFLDLTIEDCLNDNYYGSGGKKFTNWKNKHKNSLSKGIIKIFKRKSEAYEHERILVGNSYKTDPLCLNSVAGGIGKNAGVRSLEVDKKQFCDICKTNTTHRNNKCISCYMSKANMFKFCTKCKKETKHVGDTCHTCKTENNYRMNYCNTCDRNTKHSKDKCVKCYMKQVHVIKYCLSCEKETKHIGKKCHTCSNKKALSNKFCFDCEKETVHIGNICRRCYLLKTKSLKYCTICKQETKHNGNSCCKCLTTAVNSTKYCVLCKEETKHQGKNCCKCLRKNIVSLKYCSACNKETKHQGTSCYSCQGAKTAHSRWHKSKRKDGCRLCV